MDLYIKFKCNNKIFEDQDEFFEFIDEKLEELDLPFTWELYDEEEKKEWYQNTVDELYEDEDID